ncbi:replication initiation and membrane attachment family protein [Staphylococcus lutrae]|uniref:Helicase DnaB n=1 Tax=Staphylococcus lutrae TaxID=155085 RepID=A0AAC9RQ10_9STAP|nr:DnaD domain protein [Staphylococcus lutrae]ARJ49978.1 helicase DnaB [Staphylococcus lutrae]PNZ38910.1 helicase DnaB [Staphylococcus lutrae]
MNQFNYPNQLHPHDGFIVMRQFQYHAVHYDILSRLFTPLIGPEAIGVYQFLNQFESTSFDQGYTHYTIMSEMKMSLSHFREFIDLLEGIGLLKTYVRQNENTTQFVYELLPPPTPERFFNDPMLSIYFYQAVGQERYHTIKKRFLPTKCDLSGFTDVTKKFTDVFKVPKQQAFAADHQLKEAQYHGIDLTDVTFDFELLADMLQTHYVSQAILSEPTKSLIIQLATLYRLSPDVMKSIILKALNADQSLSVANLRKQAQSYYLMEHQQSLPVLQPQATHLNPSESNEDEHQINVTNWEEWFSLMDQTSPVVMLTDYGGSEPPRYQKEMIEELMRREGFNFGVINILLQFVMQKTDNQLPEKYVYSVASTWKKSGVHDARSAYKKAMEVQKNQEKSKERHYDQYKLKQSSTRRQTLDKQPRWITHPEEYAQKEEDQEALEKDRAAFLKKLERKKRAGEDK